MDPLCVESALTALLVYKIPYDSVHVGPMFPLGPLYSLDPLVPCAQIYQISFGPDVHVQGWT